MAKKKQKFPNELYVGVEDDLSGKYFVAFDTYDALADVYKVKEVAVYQLVKVTKVRTKVELD